MTWFAAAWSPRTPAVVPDGSLPEVTGAWHRLRWTAATGVAVATAGESIAIVSGRLHGVAAGEVADVVVRAHRRGGASAVAQLQGCFAALVVSADGAASAVRDVVGGVPLHLHGRRGDWSAAVRLADLLPGLRAEGGPRPSEAWVAGYLEARWEDLSVTPYQGVAAVVSGHVARLAPTGWAQRREARLPRPRRARPGREAEVFRDLFDQAVTRCTAGSARPAVALSGGLDSTSVLATLATLPPVGHGVRATALCLPMPGEAADEQATQREVAARAGADLRWVSAVDPEDPALGPFGAAPDALFSSLGAPPVATNWFLVDRLAAAAAAEGIDVGLDGEDADSLLSGGMLAYADLLATLRWRSWWREYRLLNAHRAWPGRRAFIRASAAPLVPWRRRRPSLSPPALLAEPLQRLVPAARWTPYRPGRMGRWAAGQAARPEALTQATSVAALSWAQHGVAVGHPFLDPDLVAFAVTLPWQHRLSGGYQKVVLRRAMADRLPESVLRRRTKADLSVAFYRAVMGPQARRVSEGLDAARDDTDHFDPKGVETVRQSVTQGEDLVTATRVALLASWLHWCRMGAPGTSETVVRPG